MGQDQLALLHQRQQLLQERIGSVLIAFGAAGKAATMTRRLVRAADLVEIAREDVESAESDVFLGVRDDEAIAVRVDARLDLGQSLCAALL